MRSGSLPHGSSADDRPLLLDGDPVMILTPSASGSGQEIWRCPECHVALWSRYSGFGDAVSFVRVGTLDEPQRFPPNVHIFTSTRQPWVRIPDEQPEFEAFYKLKEQWSDESRARLRKVLSG
jgi:hypothetical protein